MLTRLILRVAVLMLAVGLSAAATASANWTTYRGDAARSGVDTSSTGRLPFAPAWTSNSLGGVMWGQPVVDGGLVVVGTESDQVYALSEATGAIVWQASAGTPVPSGQLPCGDISPTVGITSTPVIDPATQRVFVVADTWDGSNATSIQHRLYAFNLANGSPVAGFPVAVDPPGSTPADQLQRAALALDGNEVVIGYGGNDGDCGTYNGWLVGASEAGGALRTFEVEKGTTGGAIWGAGSGPAVDAAGNIWAASGNGFGSFGYQESVLDLAPSLGLNAWWAPSNWQSLDTSDTDLGSTEPLLLPGGLVFDIGKAGVGYLLNAAALGNSNTAAPRYQASVCASSFGGAIYFNGVIYVACSDGLRALALNTAAPSFSPLASWHTPSSVNGPPIETGGLIWATDWNGGALYGLDPTTGQAAVTQSTPSMEHFVTPSASDGKLFLGTGDTVEAYTVANPVTPTPVAPAPAPRPAPARCSLHGPRRGAVVPHFTRRRRHARSRLRYGTLALTLRCSSGARIVVAGIISESVRGARHRRRVRRIRLGTSRMALRGVRAGTVHVRVPVAAVRGLQHRAAESARISLTATSTGGTSHAGLRIRRLRLGRRA
jgi:outer membrane protein assembly factor BamB